MPTYTFKLRSDAGWVADNVGATLADNAVAYRYACRVSNSQFRLTAKRGAFNLR